MLHPGAAGGVYCDHHSGGAAVRGAQMRHAPAGTWQLPRWITKELELLVALQLISWAQIQCQNNRERRRRCQTVNLR